MWNSSLGGAGGDGGFMNQSAFQSPSTKKKEQVRRVQNVMPLVARQIHACSEEDFTIFGVPVQIANLVGILRNFDVQSTKATCMIEDHTGSIKAILWLENESGTVTIPSIKEGCYVQVFGSIRTQEGEKIIMILKVFPVDDCNVITHHMLQVIHARLATEKFSKCDGQSVATESNGGSVLTFSNMDATGTTDEANGLTPMQNKIFTMLQGSDPIGVSRDAVLKQFPPIKSKEINDALLFLVEEGHAYTTIDREHFKATAYI